MDEKDFEDLWGDSWTRPKQVYEGLTVSFDDTDDEEDDDNKNG